MIKDELLTTLGERVRKFRKELDRTQEQVMDETGIHVGRIEQGARDITFSTLVRLSEYFGKDLNEFK